MAVAITSRSNPRLKLLRGVLAERKIRAREGLFGVEGVRLVLEATEAGLALDQLFLRDPPLDPEGQERLRQATGPHVTVYRVTQAVFDRCISVESRVDAVGLVPTWDLGLRCPEFSLEQCPSLIALEDVADPANLGACLRVADAAGMAAMVLIGRTVDLFAPKVVRASAGSLFHVRIAHCEDVAELASNLPGFSVIGFGVRGGIDYTQLDLTGPTALLFGNEARGLTEDAVRYCGSLATIPMPGRAQSLNLATAVAVAAFEVVRQRRSGDSVEPRAGRQPRANS